MAWSWLPTRRKLNGAAPEWNRLSADKHKTPRNRPTYKAMVRFSFLCVTLGWFSLGDTLEHPQQHVMGDDVVAGPKPLPLAAELVRDKCVRGLLAHLSLCD